MKFKGKSVLITGGASGIVVGKYFHEHTNGGIQRTMDINSSAPMFMTHEFLPGMMTQNPGQICYIASSARLISNQSILLKDTKNNSK